ncbi:MAG: hypothetical protein K1X78_01065 [Verrucomicrobiaceae bacterium]|nr:hypothetical protein [Verrucomicrobiaceae bacterium]
MTMIRRQGFLRYILLALALFAVSCLGWRLFWSQRFTVIITATYPTGGSVELNGISFFTSSEEGRAALMGAIQYRLGSPPPHPESVRCILEIDPDVTTENIENVFLATTRVGCEVLEVVNRATQSRVSLLAQGGSMLGDYKPVFAADAPAVVTFHEETWKSPNSAQPFMWVALTKDATIALDERNVDISSPLWQERIRDHRLIILVDRSASAGQLVSFVSAYQRHNSRGPLVLWTPPRQ